MHLALHQSSRSSAPPSVVLVASACTPLVTARRGALTVRPIRFQFNGFSATAGWQKTEPRPLVIGLPGLAARTAH